MKIFYFSGTGNARKVAQWICDYCKDQGMTAEPIDIAGFPKDKINIQPNDLLGFVSPTHGFNFPPIMIKFLLRFPRSRKNNKVFIINTRAGMKLSKIFVPGLSGIAHLLAAIILLVKGYKIVGMRPVDLPSNWISLHPGLKEKVIESLFIRRKKQVIHFISAITNGKRNYRSLLDIIQDLAISPVAVAYYCFGRFFLAKSFIASRACDNCGLCISQCPVKAIRMVDNRPFWSYRCESCMKCMNSCPKRAIETTHGLVFAVTFGIHIFLIWIASQPLFEKLYNTEAFPIVVLRNFLEPAFYITVMFSAYVITHYLRRFKVFDVLVVYTSLTKYKFWRRYKASKKLS